MSQQGSSAGGSENSNNRKPDRWGHTNVWGGRNPWGINPNRPNPVIVKGKYVYVLIELFTSRGVLQATNPSLFGYHHGPIPNAKIDNYEENFIPGRVPYTSEAQRPGLIKRAAGYLPMVRVSKVTGNVCHITVNSHQMCGKVFDNWPQVEIHIHSEHAGAVLDTRHEDITHNEQVDGEEALKLHILTGGWRRASYRHDPVDGGPVIAGWCNRLEAIAAKRPEFAQKWGRRFHRDSVPRSTLNDLAVGAPPLENVIVESLDDDLEEEMDVDEQDGTRDGK